MKLYLQYWDGIKHTFVEYGVHCIYQSFSETHTKIHYIMAYGEKWFSLHMKYITLFLTQGNEYAVKMCTTR